METEKEMDRRGTYGEILNAPTFVKQLLKESEIEGCWETGIESDKRNRGTSINTSVYGYDEAQSLAVVQVRQCHFRPGRYSKVRKDYYLVGRLENGKVFAHGIDSPIRSKLCLADAKFCVDYVLSKIWGCKIDELSDITRQGDVAFIPISHLPATAVDINGESIIIRETHKIEGKIWKDVDGTLYCTRGTRMIHTKKEHKTIKAKAGYYRIKAGYRASMWGFTHPTAD